MAQTSSCTVEYLEIDPTTRCNFSCVYCYGRNIKPNDLNGDHFIKAIELFPDLRFVELHGEGEPLLYPSLFEMAEFLESRNIKTSVFTNGSLLNPTNIQKLLETGFEKIVISLDTVNPDRFKKIRGYELQPVLDGALRLIHKRNTSKGSKPSIGIASTIFKDSIYDIPSLIYLCGLMSLDGGIGYQPLNPSKYYSRYYTEELRGQIISLQLLDVFFRVFGKDPSIKKIIDGYSMHRGFFDDLFEPVSQGIRCCPWIEKGAYLTASGYITPCCMIKEPDIIGKITNIDVVRIIQYKQQMKNTFSAGNIPTQCQDCEIASIVLNLPGNVFEPISSLSPQIQTYLTLMRDELSRWQTLLDINFKQSSKPGIIDSMETG